MTDISAQTSDVVAPAAPLPPKRKDLSNLRNRPFLIVRTITRPVKPSITRVKGWAETPANWTIYESVEVKDRVPAKDLREATVVIDIMRGICVTHRFSQKTDDEVVTAYLNTYRNEAKQGIDAYLTLMATKMAADPNFARTAEEKVASAAGIEDFEVVCDAPPAADAQ